MRRRHLPIVAFVAVAASPAGSAMASQGCSSLPVSLRLNTSDPTTLIDDASVVARSRGGAAIDALRVSVRRGDRVVSSGSLPGRLGAVDTAIRLTTAGRPGRGAYTVVASGKQRGCAQRSSAGKAVTLGAPSLPVRAAPVATIDTTAGRLLRVGMRSVAAQRITGLRAVLRTADGRLISRAEHADAFSGAVTLDLPLPSTQSKQFRLDLSGVANGASRRSTYSSPIAGSQSTITPGDTTSGDGAPPASGPAPEASATTGLRRQHVVLDWSGGRSSAASTAGYDAPGIGYGEIVCRPDAQWIRFFPKSSSDEVSMLNWTYRDWGMGNEKALREALHTAFTGPDFREGLNKFGPSPEKTSTGQFDGIISSRGLIGAPGGATAPPTTLHMTWKWDFSQAGHESCHVEADFITETAGTVSPVARSAQIVWRGDANAPGRDAGKLELPGVGAASLTCQAAPGGTRRMVIDAPFGGAVIDREGSDDQRIVFASGPISVELPNNGQLAVTLDDGSTLLISSRWKVNDPDGSQNFCAIAAQAVVGH